ncbi:hypothetical protein D3C81_1313030 [compost metagenome]
MAAGVGIERYQLVFLDQADGFAGQVHVIAHVGHGFGRYALERAIAFDFFTDHASQGGECGYQLRSGLGVGDEQGQHLARVCRHWLRVTAHQRLACYLGNSRELQRLFAGHGLVQRVRHRQRADQNQHDQPHAFLAIVGAVGKGHPGAGQDQHTTDPPGWRRLAFRCLVQLFALDQCAQRQQQQRGAGKADQWRKQQGIAHFTCLAPIHPTGAIAPVHQCIGHPDTDYRADQRVRGRGRQAQPPSAQVPDDRCQQQGEYHGEAGRRADLQNQLYRQQGNDAERHRAAGQQHPEEVAQARPDHCHRCR